MSSAKLYHHGDGDDESSFNNTVSYIYLKHIAAFSENNELTKMKK